MTRSRAAARAAGTRTETAAARYLAEYVDDGIERRSRNGAKDRGDLAGLRIHGQRVVAEVKDCTRLEVSTWLREAETERDNDDAIAGVVVPKRRGKADPADLLVICTLRDFAALLTGRKPE